MSRPAAIAAILACLLGPARAAAAPPAGAHSKIARLAWLAGCWENSLGDRRVEEQWMRPAGGTMLGMSRTIRGDRTGEYEHLLIREEGERLVYVAKPSGQEGASFASIEVSDRHVVFENRTHDFPQRIIYRIEEDGSLAARIEGERDGKTRGIDYPMRRTQCAGG